MKHINIPIFVPHMGCPNKCVFCDQHAISGVSSFCKEDVVFEIEKILDSVRDRSDVRLEIAFFGGSFTGIDRDLMFSLLDIAQSYVDLGKVDGIRMSTRPDYINDSILSILNRYTVSAVELGIQSMNRTVLELSGRGHTPEDTILACKALKEAGISFVGQMMIGLPGSDAESELECARAICEMGAVGSRIYPTIVFRGTELELMTKDGRYKPLTVEEAVTRSAGVFEVFIKNGVDCLRIGLSDTERLNSGEDFVAGPRHDAIGELVVGEYYRRAICEKIDSFAASHDDLSIIRIEAPKGETSAVIGQKRRNKEYILKTYNIKKLIIIENDSLLRYNVKVTYDNLH